MPAPDASPPRLVGTPIRHRCSRISVSGPQNILLIGTEADALLIHDVWAQGGVPRAFAHVPDGAAALRHLRDPDYALPDLIILDLSMSQQSGTELCAALKGDPSLRFIPVVILTDPDTPCVAGHHRHRKAYITRPITLAALICAVHSLDAFLLHTALPATGFGR